jgi:hypothetical protein
MGFMQWVLEIGLMGLLIATLIQAVRLGRALAVLKRDRAPLEALVNGFSGGMRDAQDGIDRLRQAADGAGKRLAQQIESGNALRDDLAYIMDRAERLADRLDHAVQATRAYEPPVRPISPVQNGFVAASMQREMGSSREMNEAPKMRSQAERDLLHALRLNK